jgi:hypothetical protein
MTNSNALGLIIRCRKEWNMAVFVDKKLGRFGIDYRTIKVYYGVGGWLCPLIGQ